MRLRHCLISAATLALLASPAMAASQKDVAGCETSGAGQIASCTRALTLKNLSSESRALLYYRRAAAWFEKSDLDRAIADFTDSIRLNPKDGDAFVERGRAWAGKGEYDRAIADETDAIRLDPKNLLPYHNRGNALVSKGEHDRAIADFNEAIRLDPKKAYVYYGRASAWEGKEDYDRAIADYTAGIRLEPNDPDYYNGRGNIWEAKDEHDRAIADYNEAIRLNPKHAYAYSGRGSAWDGKREFDRAMADFDEATRIDPKLANPYDGRAIIWRKRGQPERALAEVNEAIRLDPKNTNYYVTRAAVYYEKLDFPRAIAAYEEVVRLAPKSATVFNNRGVLWQEMGELDPAFADYNTAIRLDPKSSRAYANRGEIWRLKGDLERSLEDLDQALRLKSDDSLAFVLRGDTLRYKGEFDKALADYGRALRLDTEDIAALTGRGLTFEKMGDLGRARIEFEKAVASKSQQRADLNRQALETARARLAAFDSGALQPVIPAAPSKAASATSIPTPTVAVPVVSPNAIKQGRRVALVIGNSAYKNVPALANPKRDSSAIAASLRAVGFDSVTLANDASREKIADALRVFAGQAETADWAVVYYAGHGMEVNGVNYLIPVEARIAADRDIQFEAVPLDQVMAAVDGAKKLKLVLLDACRDNPFAPQMRKTVAPAAVAAATPTAGGAVGTRSVSRGLGEVRVSGATLVVYAAKHGQVALDGEGGNSPFAVAVAQRLATPNVEINKLFRLVRDDVMEATAGRQEPYTYGSLPGREDFFFVAGK